MGNKSRAWNGGKFIELINCLKPSIKFKAFLWLCATRLHEVTSSFSRVIPDGTHLTQLWCNFNMTLTFIACACVIWDHMTSFHSLTKVGFEKVLHK